MKKNNNQKGVTATNMEEDGYTTGSKAGIANMTIINVCLLLWEFWGI